MKKSLSNTSVALGLLLLIVLFVIATASARAGTLEERIEALEKKQMADKEELAGLRGEQTAMREDALAAKAKLPTFKYRQGAGMSIWAADRSWGFRTRIRWTIG